MYDPNQFDKSKFTNTPFVQKVEKPWGYELIFTSPGLPYTGKIMHIEAGKRLSFQVHEKKLESYLLVNGECNLYVENTKGEMETIKLEKGMGYTVVPGQKHRHIAVTDCDVFEASLAETGSVTYRLEDDYERGDEDDSVRKDPKRGWNQ